MKNKIIAIVEGFDSISRRQELISPRCVNFDQSTGYQLCALPRRRTCDDGNLIPAYVESMGIQW